MISPLSFCLIMSISPGTLLAKNKGITLRHDSLNTIDVAQVHGLFNCFRRHSLNLFGFAIFNNKKWQEFVLWITL